MVIICIGITLAYLVLIGSFVYGFDTIEPYETKNTTPKTKFSVVIPFRNEANNLPKLLESIHALNYPSNHFEVILVNDASEDDSVEIIQSSTQNYPTDIRITQNKRHSNSPKKDAISSAINQAKHEWIITTDADCILPQNWLQTFNAFLQETSTFCVAAPVTYHLDNSFLNRFQWLDLMSLQGATIGGFGLKKPFLCNGANFAYKKSLFFELSGFNGNSNIASGDDLFLLEKATQKHPKKVHYLKSEDAIVKTNAQPNWKSLVSQRVRWAAKTTAYKNGFGKLTGFLVFLMNFMVVLSLILSLLNLFNFRIFGYILTIKCSIDFYLIFKTARFLNQKYALKSYLTGFIIYPFFSVYIALVSIMSDYSWKGRTFKK
ncbi:glycosyltransferase [Tamlana agarivorans]|uniref:Glycosyltransferase n=2 Tax=Pseudotamlana agarivorans TaxID=481183 RepID=A0ACC5U6Q5_9FLAO|nr:glycosyltransferase [Tamlana agarivorans]MBU2949966.1 glycosyltransferase [Tamlana agarivorans]